MSDDSAPDPATDPQSAYESSAAPESFAGERTSKRRALRQIVLLCLLGLMVCALAYDYQVARPSVDKAYDQIVKLNDAMNANSDAIPTLSTHIHQEIGRNPARTYTEGLYRIEVFSWTAGLPFRTHDLYAVYVPNGNDLVFMRHYKFQLPAEELDPPKPPANDGTERDLISAEDAMESSMGGAGGGGRAGGRGEGGAPGEGGGRGEGGRRGGGTERGEGRPQRPSGNEEENSPAAESSTETPPAGTAPNEAAPVAAPPNQAASDPTASPAPDAAQSPAEAGSPPAESDVQPDS